MTQPTTTIMGLLARGHIDRETARDLVAALGAPGRSAERSGHVAITGVAAQLPGAPTYARFWDVLMAGEDRVESAPPRRRQLCAPVAPDPGTEPEFLTAAWLEDVDRFDARFFGVTPADARAMDPQQRRFLQTAYHCLEDAGQTGRVRGTRAGVYVSAAAGDYSGDVVEMTPSAVPGVVPSFAASRLSFLLDLHGPAFVSSATCASSLVVLHEALLGLRNGDCDTALVGGVNLFPLPIASANRPMDAAGITSDDHRCRPFDQNGTGIGRGEGVVAVFLKPLERALLDGDRVRAVIRASALNNDGASAMLTAPNPTAHTELLLDAWRRAGITPEALAYLETHGTGTSLGDPIEVRGITDAVRSHTDRRQFIAAGSVKGNIGHLVDGVAGLSGLVKALLVLEHGMVPPTVNLREPNRHIDFLDSPLFVPTGPWDLRPGRDGARPLLAGVSCFGFNGTNAHVVLEEAPHRETSAAAQGSPAHHPLVLPLSARTPTALRALLAAHARTGGDAPLHETAFSLWHDREHHRGPRVAVLARDPAQFAETCRTLAATDPESWRDVPRVRSVPGAPADGLPPEETTAQRYVDGADGADVPWRRFFADGPRPRPADLPPYPFDEESFWFHEGPDERRPRPSGDALATLLGVVADALGYEEVAEGDSFVGLGGSSLSALRIQAVLSRDHAWRLDVSDLLGAEDFGELAALVDSSHRRTPSGE
ncbi:beta-ketoacyl synthase N-terminal-like domain-containing protein [Streptomyces sp. JNUCC 64]